MSCEEWFAHHRCQGHNPYPAPTNENPERWECKCGYLWRILTGEQIRMKFAHPKHRPHFAQPRPPGPQYAAEQAAPADSRPVCGGETSAQVSPRLTYFPFSCLNTWKGWMTKGRTSVVFLASSIPLR